MLEGLSSHPLFLAGFLFNDVEQWGFISILILIILFLSKVTKQNIRHYYPFFT